MRKFLYSFLTLFLILTLFLTGCDCSCSSTQPLAFSSNAFGASQDVKDVKLGYEEVCVYNVSLDEDYNSLLKKNSSISDKVVKYDYSGILTTTLKALPVSSEYLDQNVMKSNIIKSLDDSVKIIYKFSTQLVLNVSFEIFSGNTSKTTSFVDTINSEVYFCSAKMSFAPIYSKSIKNNHVLIYSSSSAGINNIHTETTTKYNTNGYSINTVTRNKPAEDVESKIISNTTESYEYDFRSLVDNEQILFLLRNMSISSSASSLPTVLPAYGQGKNLSVKNNKSFVKEIEQLQYKGNQLTDQKIQAKDISFQLPSGKDQGMPQYVQIQTAKSESETIVNNALLLSYAQPLLAYAPGSLYGYIMGALVCNLTSVDYNIPA